MIRHAGGGVGRDPAIPASLRPHLPDDADVVAMAPGRANLIGEHTDYNGGFVLPVALELCTVVAGRRAGPIRLRSGGHGAVVEVDPATGEGPTDGWGRYVTAVVRSLRDGGRALRGIDGIVASTVPVGTGLSSSAALEVAVALAILEEPIAPLGLALACQRAENAHVGVRSGIMDPLASAASRAGSALFLDCRSLERRYVPIPAGLVVMVIDSGQRRDLADGAYNLRRAECEEAARRIGVATLRDATEAQVAAAGLPEPLAARARHVVGENARVVAAAEALEGDDRPALRELFAASHRSLADDFEVSTPDLDALVAVADEIDGIVAARMTGAGFGGCTVNLVERDRAEEALRRTRATYERRTGQLARGWISEPASGAALLT